MLHLSRGSQWVLHLSTLAPVWLKHWKDENCHSTKNEACKRGEEKVSGGVKRRHTSRNPDNEKRLSGMTSSAFIPSLSSPVPFWSLSHADLSNYCFHTVWSKNMFVGGTEESLFLFFFFMLCSMKITPVYSSIQSLNALVPLCFCPALQVTPCWNTTGWSSPPKTGTTTTRRTTAPPSTTAPGGTATATRPTSTASTCAGSTPPTRTALSGPPGPAGSIHSSFPRWRFGPPAIWKTNELFFCSC